MGWWIKGYDSICYIMYQRFQHIIVSHRVTNELGYSASAGFYNEHIVYISVQKGWDF